ncbi:hypothetical protein [Actinospongicola halichondriae]|uniref:hypothetical protein n=1 Tax=Actinospongicola halichondriae TaxID=3236844 RepID=UPI003D3DD33A
MIHPKEMATVWVIRGGDRDRRVASFLADGTIGVEFPDLPDGRTVDRAKAIRLMTTDPEAAPHEAEAAMFLSFVRRIEIGDIVVMPDPQEKGLVCGVVSGDYEYRDDPAAPQPRHRRAVEWRRRLPVSQLPERLEQIPKQRKPLDDVADGRLRALATQCCAGELGDDPHIRKSPPVRSASRSPRTRTPPRPPKATTPERRCMGCFVSKPAELFEDGGDWCRDCL